ncbi:MAG: tetratricopeptide repeat protein [Thermodesulfobacteriota bacterium]
MATGEFKRKLTAVFSADVVGYSRLMGENEAETVKTLEIYKGVMFTLIRQHRGRVIDSPGDNLLAEFASVVDAVQCAVAIQKELQARNADLPENRKMQFRIGINLGDVIEEQERIYGDGVNIAARLEALAEPGGICVSKTAFDHIESKLPLGYRFLGEQTVKNIAKPVGAYKVLMETRVIDEEGEKRETRAIPISRRKLVLAAGIVMLLVVIAALIWNFNFRRPPMEVASKEKMAFELPDKPSIAVLPFVNMSEDKGQEFFSDGMTDQIIAGLSRIPNLFIIARNSTFTYKGKPVKVKTVAEELGVRYVLEGSVQKSGDRIRITTQLIDALKGGHLWSERYDRSMKDIFALQDEITMKVVEALRIKLSTVNIDRSFGKGAQNLEAFLKFLQGWDYYTRMNPDAHIEAARYFQEAIDLDPKYAAPHAGMGLILTQTLAQGRSKTPEESIGTATRFAEKARELDESYPLLYVVLGETERFKGQFDKAINYYERGLALDPNNMGLLVCLGIASMDDGRPEEAISYSKRAIRVNPLDPSLALWGLGRVYCYTGRYEEAIPPLKQAIRNRPQMFIAHRDLAASYAGLGKEEEARAAAAEVLKMNPKFTVEGFAKIMSVKDKAVKERYLENLRKAGIPDKPPLAVPDRPSIAVLPFINMSDDKDQEYFSDGITEDIITNLSKLPRLFVVSRNSTFLYKGKQVKIEEVARDLGVRHVLEGSVRRSGGRVRITAQLIDGKTGQHLWADKYDRELKDIFSVQDDVTRKVVSELAIALTATETERLLRKYTENFEAYDLHLRALAVCAVPKKESDLKAMEMLRQVIKLDPNFPSGYSYLSFVLSRGIRFGWSASPREDLEKAFELARKAISLDDKYPFPYFSLASVYLMQGKHDDALAAMNTGVSMLPGNDTMMVFLGYYLNWVGRGEEAIAAVKKSMELNPMYLNGRSPLYLDTMGHACFTAGLYEESISNLKKSVEKYGSGANRDPFLIASYSMLGRMDEAKEAAQEWLKANPTFTLSSYGFGRLYKRPEDRDRLFEALRKAGLPD